MENSNGKTFGVAAVAIAVIALVFSIFVGASAPTGNENVGGERAGLQEFIDGIKPGDATLFTKKGTIPATENQGSWKNRLGQTVYIDAVNFGYTSGTATSSLLFYVATTSAGTISSDYAHPGGLIFPIDGATVATSSASRIFSATSTTSGFGSLPVLDGESVTFQVQERFACKVNGLCETATSSNRGITNFSWYFRAHY